MRRKSAVITALIFSVALVTATSLQAQSEEIIVTGRGLREPLSDSLYATIIIDRERLAGSASNRLEDILKDVPGIQLFRGTDARSANPTSQGITLRGLGGNASSRTLLLPDGVPQTDPFGERIVVHRRSGAGNRV